MVFALLLAVAAVSAVSDCHNLPRADWATLNQTVGGRLHSAAPLALPCFSSYNNVTVTPNPTLCSEVMSNYFNPDYRVSKYAAAMQVKFFRHLFILYILTIFLSGSVGDLPSYWRPVSVELCECLRQHCVYRHQLWARKCLALLCGYNAFAMYSN